LQSEVEGNADSYCNSLEREGTFERELELLKAAHSTFTDLRLITDVSGVRATLPEASQAAWGFLLGKRVLQILSSYLSDFFGVVLRGNEREGLLSGPSKKFPRSYFWDTDRKRHSKTSIISFAASRGLHS
jgi:hypothetical protein